jgi:hypothetical protein
VRTANIQLFRSHSRWAEVPITHKCLGSSSLCRPVILRHDRKESGAALPTEVRESQRQQFLVQRPSRTLKGGVQSVPRQCNNGSGRVGAPSRIRSGIESGVPPHLRGSPVLPARILDSRLIAHASPELLYHKMEHTILRIYIDTEGVILDLETA